MSEEVKENYPSIIKPFFILSALYDGILGLLFFIIPAKLFEMVNVPPVNHFGYVQFSALVLIIFAWMFLQIAKNPIKNKELIVYGILLKLSYCSVAFYYWIMQDIPFIWKPFAIFDTLFLLAFIWSYKVIKD